MSPSEFKVFVVGAAVVLGWIAVRLLKRWFAQPVSPDPWGPEIAQAMEAPDARPVCPHCQCPYEDNRWFCPECGHSIGDYNNLNPYLYLFSLGDVLREGTSGHVRKSWLTIAGFLVLSTLEYLVLAPIYWYFFFRNLSRQSPGGADAKPPVITHC